MRLSALSPFLIKIRAGLERSRTQWSLSLMPCSNYAALLCCTDRAITTHRDAHLGALLAPVDIKTCGKNLLTGHKPSGPHNLAPHRTRRHGYSITIRVVAPRAIYRRAEFLLMLDRSASMIQALRSYSTTPLSSLPSFKGKGSTQIHSINKFLADAVEIITRAQSMARYGF